MTREEHLLVILMEECAEVAKEECFPIMKKELPLIIISIFLLYSSISWLVFSWRNPTANSMSYFREWSQVMTWKTLPEYQLTR